MTLYPFTQAIRRTQAKKSQVLTKAEQTIKVKSSDPKGVY
jgi:hypothetical protein